MASPESAFCTCGQTIRRVALAVDHAVRWHLVERIIEIPEHLDLPSQEKSHFEDSQTEGHR